MNALGIEQLRTIGNIFLIDVFLSAGNTVEPHYHYNAAELIYCVTGETTASMINPFTNELKNVRIGPQQVVTIPQGWWHYFAANKDNTHVLTIYDIPALDTVWGSDVLRLTPPQVFAHTYCLNEDQIEQALAPITERVIIGPPEDCSKPEGWGHGYRQSSYGKGHQDEAQPAYMKPPYYPHQPHFPYYQQEGPTS